MARQYVLFLAVALTSGLCGQKVDGLYSTMARELPDGRCLNNSCSWSLEQLLTYYGYGLDKDRLKAALHDSRADVRSMAADELATNQVKSAIPWLAEALASERVVGTRMYLAYSLARLGDARGMPVLESLCRGSGQSDPGVEAFSRLRAAQFLWQLHQRSCVDCTIDLLRTLDVRAASSEFDLMAAAMSLATAFESPSEPQAEAIRILAERWISSASESVRRQASRALALYGDEASYEKLRAALAAEREPMARQSLQENLQRLKGRLRSRSE